MMTMGFDIKIGNWHIGMVDKVEIHRSVELLADVCQITLPAIALNAATRIEQLLHRGDRGVVRLGYQEWGLNTEFEGYLLSVNTDNGHLTLELEDDLYRMRKSLRNATLKNITLTDILVYICEEIGEMHSINCAYHWVYEKFTIQGATAYDVLKKVQDECGADIYIQGETLFVQPPGKSVGVERRYDFGYNIEESDLTYRRAEDKKFEVTVKATEPDGTVKEIKIGNSGGEKLTVMCATSDEASMRQRAEAELKRRAFTGYDGSITTWLLPMCCPGDSAYLQDDDYVEKNGSYFVRSVKTSFSPSGGKREIELGFRLS